MRCTDRRVKIICTCTNSHFRHFKEYTIFKVSSLINLFFVFCPLTDIIYLIIKCRSHAQNLQTYVYLHICNFAYACKLNPFHTDRFAYVSINLHICKFTRCTKLSMWSDLLTYTKFALLWGPVIWLKSRCREFRPKPSHTSFVKISLRSFSPCRWFN